MQDLRYALRAIRRTPVFSAIAIGCLAIGIGVNVAAFSMLDALILRDLPGVREQRRLTAVLVSVQTRWGRTSPSQISPLDWELFRNGVPAFTSSGVTGFSSVVLRVGGEPIAVRADFVSGGFFPMLGTRPAAGRLLTESDDRADAPPAVVIGHQLWQREFGGRADVIGKPLVIGNVAFTIAGVAPQGYVGLYPGELNADPEFGAPYVVLPLATAGLVRAASRYRSDAEALDDEWLLLVGRRAGGVSSADVEAQAASVAARLASTYPDARAKAVAVARDPSTGSTVELIAAVGFVMAIPLLVLLVACANLANQLLARAAQRGREIAVRLSLGASRARLVRLLLVESTVLAVGASVVAVLLARLLTDVVGTRILVMPFRVPIDERALVFTLALAVVTATAFGLAPALRATRLDLAQSMKDGAGAGGSSRSRFRNALVIVQVAASVALLTIAGVFLRASERSRVADAAANADRVLTVAVELDLLDYPEARGRAFQASAMERLRAIPGVEAVALAPFGAISTIPEARVAIAGDAADRERYADIATVGGDWFAVHDMRPIAGRVFSAAESRGAPTIAVVNQAAADRLWPGENAVGRTIRIGEDSVARIVTVIGVVPAAKRDPRDNGPHRIVTVPAGAAYDRNSRFHVRTRGSAAALRAPVRAAIHEIDPRLPLPAVVTLGESVAEVVSGVAQLGSGVAAMGGLALMLAALGLFAVLAFIVEQRRYEIGVRIALGAQASAVTAMILRQSLSLAAIGIVAGAAIAATTTVLLRSMLFGLPPIDAVAFTGSTLVILVVATVASLVPARTAARVDPLVALRSE